MATVTQKSDLDFLEKCADPPVADILEFRVDSLSEYLTKIRPFHELPSLLTVRSPKEGGADDLSAEDRFALYQELLPIANLIDIEIDTIITHPDRWNELRQEAQRQSVVVVGSFHDFQSFPGPIGIHQQIETAFEFGVDIAKCAVVCDSLHEVLAMSNQLLEYRDANQLVSLMGMGSWGKLSRIILSKAGSVLNYGFLQTANAPGQWSAEKLRSLIDEC